LKIQSLGYKGNIDNTDKFGRVTAVFKNSFKVIKLDLLEELCTISGKLRYADEFPGVGDFVEIEDKVINKIYPRATKVSRKIAGKITAEQIIASNLDYIFIVTSLNDDFNIARLERYLTVVYDSGAMPVFILTKSDIAEDIQEKRDELEGIAFGVPIHTISNLRKEGIEELSQYFTSNNTVALIESSGVGKSTLINNIIGKEVLKTSDIREKDSKGKHTTTHRELFFLEEAIIIDTPGIRELQIWDGDIEKSFSDIEELARSCRFNDCQHDTEPECAVKKAISNGEISEERLKSYRKILNELEYIEIKKNSSHKQAEKEKIKKMMGSLNAQKQIKHRPN